MSDSWKQWEGQTVDGAFPLLRYLGGSQRGAVFFTEHREHGKTLPAAIRLVLSSSQKAEQRLARWQQAANLSHPQLIPLYQTGRFEMGAVPLVYVVMEMADENLGQVLSERPLTPDETRVMLESVLDVLRHLHSKGYVHGRIKPSSIMALGDQLKMSSDRICRAGEPLENPGDPDEYDPPEYARGIIPVPEKTSPAADIWSLGLTLIETLTKNPPPPRVAGQNPMPSVPENLPQPFAEIVSHCLRAPQDRWTAAQIADCLSGRTPIRTPARPPVQTRRQAPVETPLRAEQAPPVAAAGPEFIGERSRTRIGFGAFAAVAFAVAVVVTLATLVWIGRRNEEAQSQAPAPRVAQSQAQPSPSAPSQTAPLQTGQVTPNRDTSSPVVRGTPPAAPPSTPNGGSAAGGSNQPRLNAALGGTPANSQDESAAPAATAFDAGRPNRPRALREAADSGELPGGVASQVLPQVSRSSLDTIQGTVKVKIKVEVDPAGGVTDAQFESQGPSKYFAKQSLQAAQDWKFKAPQAGGRQVASTWDLQFEFNRDGAKAVPTQTAP